MCTNQRLPTRTAASQRPPRLCKHKATGRAYVTLNGREYYLGTHGTEASRAAYASLIAQWIQGGGHYRPNSQQEITVAEVMASYIGFAESYYRKNGKVTCEYGLILDTCRVAKPLFGRSRAAEFGPLALKTVRQALVDSGISRDHMNWQTGRDLVSFIISTSLK